MKTRTPVVLILCAGLGARAQFTPSGQTQIRDEPSTQRAAQLEEHTNQALDEPNVGSSTALQNHNNNLGYWTAAARDGESAVSVVSFKEPKQQTLDETAEDLNILTYLLSQSVERAFAGQREDYKLGIPMLLKSGGRSVEAAYLEGFGAVFGLRVRFPLVAPATEEKGGPEGPENSDWEAARRALMGADQAVPHTWRPSPYEEGQVYDAKLVETLRSRILQALRNASHLRHVQPDEWVVVTVTGTPNLATGGGGSQGAPGMGGRGGQGGNKDAGENPGQNLPANKFPMMPDRGVYGSAITADGKVWFTRSDSRPGAARLTIMTIRIKKAVADAFAANKMSEEEFLREAQVASYLGPVIVGGASPGMVYRLTGY